MLTFEQSIQYIIDAHSEMFNNQYHAFMDNIWNRHGIQHLHNNDRQENVNISVIEPGYHADNEDDDQIMMDLSQIVDTQGLDINETIDNDAEDFTLSDNDQENKSEEEEANHSLGFTPRPYQSVKTVKFVH